MEPWHHAAGRGLCEPKGHFGTRLRNMPPVRLGIAVSPGDIRDGAALHYGLGDAALLRAVPNGRFARAALMIGVEPCRHLAYLLQVFHRIEPAAEVADVHRLRVPLAGNAVPEAPDLHDAIDVRLIVLAVKRIGGIGFGWRDAA